MIVAQITNFHFTVPCRLTALQTFQNEAICSAVFVSSLSKIEIAWTRRNFNCNFTQLLPFFKKSVAFTRSIISIVT